MKKERKIFYYTMNEGKTTVALGVNCKNKLLGRGIAILNEKDDQLDPKEGRKHARQRLLDALKKQLPTPAYKRMNKKDRIRLAEVLKRFAELNLPFTEKSVFYPQPTPFEYFYIRALTTGSLDEKAWELSNAWEEIQKLLPKKPTPAKKGKKKPTTVKKGKRKLTAAKKGKKNEKGKESPEKKVVERKQA